VAFIVDGADWDFTGLDSDRVEDLIDRALEFVRVSRHRLEDIAIGDDFQNRGMYGNLSIWELFAAASPIKLSGEIRQELAAWLGSARQYLDADEWPEGFVDTFVSVNGAVPSENPDIAWVHCCVLAGTPAACFALGGSRIATTATGAGSADLHFVADEAGRRKFWRKVVLLQGDNLESLLRYSQHAYPNLHFVDGTLQHADQLAGGYLGSRQKLQQALAVLDDWGCWVFTWPPPSITANEGPPPDATARPNNQLVRQRLSGFGIDASLENANVQAHRASREARETVIGSRTLYCEWHVKLEPHRNRIHFHAPIPESGEKVVIGMIHEHLPLP
jgi:hypothetical protein